MDASSPNPSAVPPQIPSVPAPYPAAMPLGENAEEREAIPNTMAAIEALLRQPRRVMFQLRQPGAARLLGGMLVVAVVCSLIYGVVVGTFSMGMQLWAAPLKIAGGLLFAAIICLPSLYIFACLGGSRARLPEIAGLTAGMLALMAMLLIGFAPVAWLFSQSTEFITWMGALHLVFWGVAALFGLRFLKSGFSHYEARSSAGLNVWILIFVLVTLQMTTALRPIVGTAETLLPSKKEFFLSHWADWIRNPAPRGTETELSR